MGEAIIWFTVTMLSLAVGSFLNVIIYRVPRGENIAFPASHCTSCGKELKWYHNIPLLSWLYLGGKCAYCKSPISPRYPVIEALNAALWAILYMKLGLSLEFIFAAASFSALLALTAIDFEYYAVPDSVNFFALGAALLTHSEALMQGHYRQMLHSVQDAAMAAGGLWLLAFIIGKAAKKEAMGGADVIVAGTMAALLGISHFFVAIFLSAILAILPSIAAKDTRVPFVPFLSLATLIVYLFDSGTDRLMAWILYG